MDSPAPIGHNHPPADSLAERLLAGHAALSARMYDLLDAEARLPDELTADTVGVCTDYALQCQACMKDADAIHKAEKAPYLEAGRIVDSWRNNFRDSLSPVVRRVQAQLNRFLYAKDQRAREALTEEADRLIAKAEIAEKEGEADRARMLRLQAADHLYQVRHATPADLVRTATALGGVATLSKRWGYEVEDWSKVNPATVWPYLEEEAIDRAIRAAIRDGVREIPGLIIKETTKALLR